jgi:hypothetical protein
MWNGLGGAKRQHCDESAGKNVQYSSELYTTARLCGHAQELTCTVLEETVQGSNPTISEHQTDTVQPGPAGKLSDYIKHLPICIIMYAMTKPYIKPVSIINKNFERLMNTPHQVLNPDNILNCPIILYMK